MKRYVYIQGPNRTKIIVMSKPIRDEFKTLHFLADSDVPLYAKVAILQKPSQSLIKATTEAAYNALYGPALDLSDTERKELSRHKAIIKKLATRATGKKQLLRRNVGAVAALLKPTLRLLSLAMVSIQSRGNFMHLHCGRVFPG